MKLTQIIDQFQRARRDDTVAVIEGVQALKHAVRFQAEIQNIVTCDKELLERLLHELAPDIYKYVLQKLTIVDEAVFNQLSPQPPRTKVIALAMRNTYTYKTLDIAKRLVFIEDPRDLENIGAVIRVSAAADAGGVIITGPVDVWHPAVIRGAAGLHYSLPVLNITSSNSKQNSDILASLRHIQNDRKLIALDPTGMEISSVQIPSNAILLFGTERHGISRRALEASNEIVRLPMRPGVSSLNLATSVAATLYSLKG